MNEANSGTIEILQRRILKAYSVERFAMYSSSIANSLTREDLTNSIVISSIAWCLLWDKEYVTLSIPKNGVWLELEER